MILANGLIRTLDPQVPTQRALAIAGELVAGGVGVHETALASPEVTDLGGLVVVPGFTDSHVHFPTWALAQNEVSLDGCANARRGARADHAASNVQPGRWLRGYGWRSGDWQPQRDPTRQELDAITAETPAGLIAKDYHSLWLNSAALALADGDLEVEGGVVERDASGEPTGILREEAAWRFKERHMIVSDADYLDAMRAGVRLANSRGVTAVHDKDGWLGALRLWQQLEERRPADAARLAVDPPRRARRRRRRRAALRIRQLAREARLPEGVHGRHARLADRLDARRQRRADHERRRARRDRPARSRGRVPGRGPRDRRPCKPGGTRRVRADEGRVGAARSPPAHRARPAARARGCRSLRRARRRRARCSSRTHRPIAISPTTTGRARPYGAYAFRSLLHSGAVVVNGSDAPIEELDPLAGISAGVRRTIDDRPSGTPSRR